LLEDNNQEARIWGMFCHLSALLGLLLMFLGIPFLGILMPLIIWKLKKDNHPFIDVQGKESLNFQISMAIYGFVVIGVAIVAIFLFYLTYAIVTISILNNVNAIFFWIVIIFLSLVVLILVFESICIIFAAIKAYKGEFYRYPLTLRFLR